MNPALLFVVNVVIVAVIAVVAVIVVAFVAGVIGWWIHKRRKCLKDPRSKYLLPRN